MKIDESDIPMWLWGLELLLVNMWIPMDIWLRRHGHEYLTTEFRETLARPIAGPILAVTTFATFGVFIAHMWWRWLG